MSRYWYIIINKSPQLPSELNLCVVWFYQFWQIHNDKSPSSHIMQNSFTPSQFPALSYSKGSIVISGCRGAGGLGGPRRRGNQWNQRTQGKHSEMQRGCPDRSLNLPHRITNIREKNTISHLCYLLCSCEKWQTDDLKQMLAKGAVLHSIHRVYFLTKWVSP